MDIQNNAQPIGRIDNLSDDYLFRAINFIRHSIFVTPITLFNIDLVYDSVMFDDEELKVPRSPKLPVSPVQG